MNDTNDEGLTKLMYSCKKISVEGVKLLINYGADLNIRDNYGRTALHWCVVAFNRSNEERIRAKVKDIAEILLDNGADPNIMDYYDIKPLDLARILYCGDFIWFLEDYRDRKHESWKLRELLTKNFTYKKAI